MPNADTHGQSTVLRIGMAAAMKCEGHGWGDQSPYHSTSYTILMEPVCRYSDLAAVVRPIYPTVGAG